MSPTATAETLTPDTPAEPSALRHVDAIPIGDIVPSPLNPRKHFGDLLDLADSIKAHGLVVPLITRLRKGKHEVVDGERRYRAAKQAGVLFLTCIAQELTDAQVLELQLLTAVQREALTPIEEARGYKALLASSPSKYSPAYIADRISRSERYVVDRMRLLDLIPALQQLLDDDRIGVGHAELLAKLKPEDQQRAAGIASGEEDLAGPEDGGLWEHMRSTLDFDLEHDDDVDPRERDPFFNLKPVTVKELEAWIARHVRFDVTHAATTAPLDYGTTAMQVEAASAKPGRGKKVIAITADYRVDDDARTDERVYGSQSWRRADGSTGTTRNGQNRLVDSQTCEHSVLGVFAVGPGYGTTLQVCIARDRCQVHFGKEIKEREKNATLRAAGQGGKADARERKEVESYEARQAREAQERRHHQAAFKVLQPQLIEAITSALPSTLDRPLFEFLYRKVATYGDRTPKDLKPAKFIDALVMAEIKKHKGDWRPEEGFRELVAIAKHFGVKANPFTKAYADHVAQAKKAAATPAPAKASAKKPAKKR